MSTGWTNNPHHPPTFKQPQEKGRIAEQVEQPEMWVKKQQQLFMNTHSRGGGRVWRILKSVESKKTKRKEKALNCEGNQKKEREKHTQLTIPWGAALFFIFICVKDVDKIGNKKKRKIEQCNSNYTTQKRRKFWFAYRYKFIITQFSYTYTHTHTHHKAYANTIAAHRW